MSTRESDLSTQQVADQYRIARQTVLSLMHQGSFGPRGKGYRVINPEAKRPQYRITKAGLAHYERITAA